MYEHPSILVDAGDPMKIPAAQAMTCADSELRYRRLFESAKDGILIVDAETGAIQDVNPFLINLLGYPKEAFLDQKFWKLGLFSDFVSNLEHFEELKKNKYIRYDDRPLRCSDGRQIAVEFVSNVYMVDGQQVIQCNIRDISERVAAKRELLELNANLEFKVRERTAQLEAVNQELEAFSYSISHDLQAPLRSIAGFSEAVIEDYASLLPQEGQEYLQHVRDEALRMSVLIQDLLRLSGHGRQEMSMEELDITALARSILQGLALQEPDRKVQFVLDPAMKIHGDSALVRVLMDNLLGNAWKFTSRAGDACIQVRRYPCGPEWAGFAVSDNGAGFDPIYVDRIFMPFRRLHTAKEFPGTGIGLAIVKRIVQRHGATIQAEGSPGKGAAFTLSFPGQQP